MAESAKARRERERKDREKVSTTPESVEEMKTLNPESLPLEKESTDSTLEEVVEDEEVVEVVKDEEVVEEATYQKDYTKKLLVGNTFKIDKDTSLSLKKGDFVPKQFSNMDKSYYEDVEASEG